MKTQEEKFLELMNEFRIKSNKKRVFNDESIYDVSNYGYVACNFKFDKDGNFKEIDCYN